MTRQVTASIRLPGMLIWDNTLKAQKALHQGIVTMKTSIQLIRYVVIALLITIGMLGFKIASVTIYYYTPVARGVLGLVAIYLAFQEASSSRSKNPLDGLFLFPKNIKYFIYTFCSVANMG